MLSMIQQGAPVSYILLFLLMYVLAAFLYTITFFKRFVFKLSQDQVKDIESRLGFSVTRENFFKIMKEDFLLLVFPEFKSLEKHMHYVKLIINLAPLIGLLGTIMGIIDSTEGIVSKDTSVLLAGIAKSLVNTALGLCVSIPSLFVSFFARKKVTDLLNNLKTEFFNNL